jgi:hypothetical protein
MLVRRQVVFNPLEPAVMSLRVPVNQPVTLLVEVLDANGAPVTTVMDAALFMVSRSSATVQELATDNTDTTNGKVTFEIGEDALADRNGYNVQLYGDLPGATIDPEIDAPYRWMIAAGVLRLLAGEE